MKKRSAMIVIGMISVLLCACSNFKYVEERQKWDCSVECMEESDDSYVITYSDEKVVSGTGVLSFQNRNQFDIVVHLLAAGQKERTAEIGAGGVAVLFQVSKGMEYTVGCHADVSEGDEIKLMVYDGEGVEVYVD